MPGVPFWDAFEEGYEGPLYSPDPWELLILNGFKVPGISTVKCIPKMKLDIPKETGRDGGPTVEKGHEPAKVDIQIKVWTPRQWEGLQAVLLGIWRRPGQASRYALSGSGKVVESKRAVEITHPACALYGVTAVAIESPESPEPGPEIGTRIIRLRAVQVINPTKKTATKSVKGAGPPLTKEFEQANNGIKPNPSLTEAVPVLPPKPNQGGT